jgi:predicted DNA-binding protein
MISKDSDLAKKPRPHVAAKIPHEVHAQLIRFKESTGKTESQILNEAIAAYLGIEAKETVPDAVSQLSSDVSELKQQVKTILGKFKRLSIQ